MPPAARTTMPVQGEYKPLCFRRSDETLAKALTMVNDQDEELKTELLQCASYIHEYFLLLYETDGFQDYIIAYGALEGFCRQPGTSGLSRTRRVLGQSPEFQRR
jgi:hypothetical protein